MVFNCRCTIPLRRLHDHSKKDKKKTKQKITCHQEALFGDMFCISETAVINADICTGTPGRIKEMRI